MHNKIHYVAIILLIFTLSSCKISSCNFEPFKKIVNVFKPDPIDVVKKGTLEFDTTVTVGDALEKYKYFSKTEWKKYDDEQNRKVVEFNGSFDFNKLVGIHIDGTLKLLRLTEDEIRILNARIFAIAPGDPLPSVVLIKRLQNEVNSVFHRSFSEDDIRSLAAGKKYKFEITNENLQRFNTIIKETDYQTLYVVKFAISKDDSSKFQKIYTGILTTWEESRTNKITKDEQRDGIDETLQSVYRNEPMRVMGEAVLVNVYNGYYIP